MNSAFTQYISFSKHLFCAIILATPLFLSAQDATDSLYQEILQASFPEDKVEQYSALFKYLGSTNDPRVKEYAEELYSFSEKNNLPKGLAYANNALGFYHVNRTGDLEAALQHYKDARDQFAKAGDSPQAVKASINLGIALERLGKWEQQEQAYDDALQIAEKSGDPVALQMAYRAKGERLGFNGQVEEALQYLGKALKENEKLDEPFQRALILFGKGRLLSQTAPEKALEPLKEAEQIAMDIGEHHFVVYVRQSLSNTYQRMGDFNQAIEVTTSRLTDAEAMGDVVQAIHARNDLGPLYTNFQDAESALEQYQKALEMAESIDYPDGKVASLGNLGLFHSHKNDCEKALPYFQKAMSIADTLGKTLMKLDILYEVGVCYLEVGDLENGKKCFEETLTLNAGQDESRDQYANLGLGIYQYELKNYRKAIEYLMPVQAYASENKDFILLKDASQYLRVSHRSLGNYKEALTWTETFMVMNDSIKNSENLRKITTLRLTAGFEKEKELLALEQKQNEALLKAETQQTRTVAFAIGALALLGFGFFWNARSQNKVIAAQNQQLEQLNHTKDRIFSIIGHDLRKPAIAFRGITQKVNYLLKKQDYAKLERFGDEIEKDALALNQLTDNLLNWALTQKNIMPYKPEAFKVADIVANELTIFEKVAAEKRIELVSEVPSSLAVFADANALRVIVRNLIDNAVKYTPTGGRVAIVAEEGAEGVKIIVTDTGIGMPTEKLNDIFMLREGKSEKGTAGEKGAGLGLHLVNELVQLNKGFIEVTSLMGRGSQFAFSLPKMA